MKNKLLKIVNPLLLVSMLAQAVSGMGMGKFGGEVMHKVHEINAPVLSLLFIAHFILNFQWFVSLVRGFSRR